MSVERIQSRRLCRDVTLSCTVGGACALLYFVATRVLNSRVKLNPWLTPVVGGGTAIASFAGLHLIRTAASSVFAAGRHPSSADGQPISGPEQRTSTTSSVESSSSESSDSGSASPQTREEKEAKRLGGASVREFTDYFSDEDHLEAALKILPHLEAGRRAAAAHYLITCIASLENSDQRESWADKLAQVFQSDTDCFRRAAGGTYSDDEIRILFAVAQKIDGGLQILEDRASDNLLLDALLEAVWRQRRPETFPEEVDCYVNERRLRSCVTPKFCQHCRLSPHALEVLPQILVGNHQMLECASKIVKREDVAPEEARVFVDALPLREQHSHLDGTSLLLSELNRCDLKSLDDRVCERVANWFKGELQVYKFAAIKECSARVLEKLFEDGSALVELLDLNWSWVHSELTVRFSPAPFELLRAKHSIQSNPMLLPVFSDVIDDSAALLERFDRLEDFRLSRDPSKWRVIGIESFDDYINYLCLTERTPRYQTLLELFGPSWTDTSSLTLAWCQFICKKLSTMEIMDYLYELNIPDVVRRSLIDRLRIVSEALFRASDVKIDTWEEQSSSLLQLPAELLAMILEYSDHKDLANLSQVSRQLHCFAAERRISLQDLEQMRLERLSGRYQTEGGEHRVCKALLLAMPREQLASYAQINENLQPPNQAYRAHLSGTELTTDRIQELLDAGPLPATVLVRLCRDDAERHARAMAQGNDAAKPTVLQAVLSYLLDPDTALLDTMILRDISLYALLPESLESISTCLSQLGSAGREFSRGQLDTMRGRFFVLLGGAKCWADPAVLENLDVTSDVSPYFRTSLQVWKRLWRDARRK